MMIDSTNSLARPQAVDHVTADQSSGVSRDAFMKLLVTQLQNQDPLDPMDSRQMVSQLTELTSVEQLLTIDHRLQALEVATAGLANTEVASLVGKTVTADSSALRLEGDGTVTSVYSLGGRADEVTIEIKDAEGNVVRTLSPGAQQSGMHEVTWDGLMEDGTRAPAGRYRMEIKAKDVDGHEVAATTEVSGRVDGITYENGYPELLIGRARVLLGDVQAIQ
jgi:flagellar basal-body rod modification protein FlgD